MISTKFKTADQSEEKGLSRSWSANVSRLCSLANPGKNTKHQPDNVSSNRDCNPYPR